MHINQFNIGVEWGQAFKENKSLVHIDLSHNNFKKADCRSISEGLKENHTILGLHLMGNEVDTDSRGFMKDAVD